MVKRSGNYKRKWDTEKCKKFIEENDIEVELLSEYVDSYTKMLFRCKCGDIFETNWHEFNNKKFPKRQCNGCGRKKPNDKNKITCEYIRKYLQDNNYTCKLLSNTYIDCDSKLEFECECGDVFYSSWSNIKKIKGLCKNCSLLETSKKLRMSNYDIQKQIDDVYGEGEYVLIDRTSLYVTIKHLTCGNEFVVKKSHFVDGQGCKFCNLKNRDFGALSNEEFLNRVSKYMNDFEFLSEYKNQYEHVKIRHKKCGHIIYASPIHIYERGIYCKYCGGSKGEQMIARYLESIDARYIPQYIFENCKYKRKLSFDFYLPEHNVAIEYQGEQHYKPVDIFGGEEKLKDQKKRDEIKRSYCKNNNITLIEISYNDFNRINEILDELLSLKKEVV